ncbi:SDR family oxidoreductase [bacterium]|nr:SDR family oxidoreductase [bacterium]
MTGASRGIGAALAPALGEKKARLTLVARDERALEETAARTRERGGEAIVVAGDVASPETARRAVAAAASAFSTLDLLVNNAGVLTRAPLLETPIEDWRRVLEVNVLGTVAFLREALAVMVARKRGACVNLSSGWGRSAEAEVAPYVASKWAVEGLTRSVALEVPRGIAVVAVNPGIIRTEMLDLAFGKAESSAYPPPEALAPRFVRLLEALDASWNGRSLDADDF